MKSYVLKSIIFFTLSIFINSCIVTDDIEFDEKINYSPTLIEAVPYPDKMNYALAGTKLTFKVIVKDPDKKDFDYYDARIFLIETVNSSITKTDVLSCREPVSLPLDEGETGIKILVECQVTLRASIDTTSSLQVKVQLSDRGYDAGNTIADNANILDIMWTYELLKQTL